MSEKMDVGVHFLDLPLVDLFDNIAQHLEDEDLLAFGACSQFCRNLVDKKIKKLIMLDEFNITAEEAFKLALQVCTHLTRLSIGDVEDVSFTTDEMYIELLSSNPNLLGVFIAEQPHITVRALQPLVHCKNLISLTLCRVQCDDKFLQDLSASNTKLEEIDFYRTTLLTNTKIAEFIATQPHLRYISVSGSDLGPILKAVCSFSKELVCLGIPHYAGDYDEILMSIPDHCPKLKMIALDKERVSPRVQLFFLWHNTCCLGKLHDNWYKTVMSNWC